MTTTTRQAIKEQAQNISRSASSPRLPIQTLDQVDEFETNLVSRSAAYPESIAGVEALRDLHPDLFLAMRIDGLTWLLNNIELSEQHTEELSSDRQGRQAELHTLCLADGTFQIRDENTTF